MAAKRGITLYHSPGSRAFIAYWLLEEIGVPFGVTTIDIAKGEQKKPEYLKLNPAGKVPTLTDGDVVVSENPAIGIYLPTATATAGWPRAWSTRTAGPI